MQNYLHNYLTIFVSLTVPSTPRPEIIHLLVSWLSHLFHPVHAWLLPALAPTLGYNCPLDNSGLSAKAMNFGSSLMLPFGSIFPLPLAPVGFVQIICALPRILEPALPPEMPRTAYLGGRQALCLLLVLQRRLGHNLCPKKLFTCFHVLYRRAEI